MEGGNLWHAPNTLTLDGPYTVPNNHAIDCTSTQPEDSQEQNRADTDMEVNGNDHQTLNYFSAQPGFSTGPRTAALEVNDNNHQALDSPQVQPGSSDFSPDKASTKLEMNDKSHQTFDYLSAQQGSFQAAETPRRNNREDRENTKAESNRLKTENNRLKTENNRLNEERFRKYHASKSQEEEIKHLQQEVGRLEGSLDTQNIVVEALTKQLCPSITPEQLHRPPPCLSHETTIPCISFLAALDSTLSRFSPPAVAAPSSPEGQQPTHNNARATLSSSSFATGLSQQPTHNNAHKSIPISNQNQQPDNTPFSSIAAD
ncbi:hypothetical protein D5086_000674 [Populus alba]|uniref:Uncharacterized protein n=1 Tax=Populus alba TaxID=43335 RepID=A0ACC4CXX1_POPAL